MTTLVSCCIGDGKFKGLLTENGITRWLAKYCCKETLLDIARHHCAKLPEARGIGVIISFVNHRKRTSTKLWLNSVRNRS